VFQAPDRTLTDAELESTLATVGRALVDELGARLRT
jgi:phenylalanyl-tRNA synthetase beta subunit